MRMRIIATAVVLGLGIVGITLAQQAGRQPKDQAGDRAKLRAQVARLRAEVEVLELEHGVDIDLLREIMKEMKQAELMASMKGPMKQTAESMIGQEIEAKQGLSQKQKEDLKAAAAKELPAALENMPLSFVLADDMFGGGDVMVKLGRPVVDRLKKGFVQKAADLAEKRLELADLEKRYNEVR